MFVCTDCVMIIVNNDDSGMSADKAAHVRKSLADYPGEIVVNTDIVRDFSTSPCFVCGDHLAGTRVALAAY